MKVTKKILAVMLTTILAVSLVACGKDAKDTGNGKSSKDGKVKITYSMWGSADEGAVTQKLADKFNASQDRIEVDVLAIPWENYMTKLNTMATAKELPDTGIMSEAGVLQWAEQGMLADISTMYGKNDSKPLDSLAFRYQGKTVAYSAANEVLLLYYNKDMFDKAGATYPPASVDNAWTWEEFVSTAKKLTLDKNGKHPDEKGFDEQNIVQYGCLVENLAWQLELWPMSNGAGYYSSDGSEVTIDNQASIEAIQKVADLYLVDHVAPLSTGATDDSIQRSIISGTCAMGTGGAWNVGTCLASAREEGLNYGVAVLPYMKEKLTLCTGGPNVVFSQTKHPEEAMEWLKWYYQEENSWSLIETGIWMPILQKWYTDETMTHKWVDNKNFPPYEEYKSAVVDYAMKNSKSASWYYVNNTVDFNNLVTSILGEVWTGKVTAQEAITKNMEALKTAYKGTAK
ncbi:ABC transporter substrate-binding protein [Lachnoclostridium phytofermentans]|uniref:Extracellular solute-binding protein family 1 n=1 Tax=Lachnoclostridium phytofermentans (strain ATCC 700394 / DSM 18823 / ISDg) TaxID=357809 RepID=A9KIY0_LACP7|nr:sugar ABC transporter substrate-binding protein [Lachnoclostridium phytofermentans]ABX40979.1 extracellular solute-binding protein family 1 [Lachnoclostridium phytofermentans ISDg]